MLCSCLHLPLSDMQHVSSGQPFRLNLLAELAKLSQDPDPGLPALLDEGLHAGVFSEIEPSGLWPAAKLQPLAHSSLEVCEGNWKPAEQDPDTVASLLAQEEASGWIARVEGGLEQARLRWPKNIAVGRLSLVKADHKEPRLVLDSTVCQVNPLCRIPESVSLPTVHDVRLTFGASDPKGAFLAASIDFKAAHKRMKVHESEQGLLLFAFQGVLWRYLVCHFGAKFSAYWWQRLGALLTRLTHKFLAFAPHKAWLYVDDLLSALHRGSARELLFILIAFLACIRAPISWKKASVGDSLVWCGWRFHFAYETVELCADKRLKLCQQIRSLLARRRVPRKDLEACVGLLMWATHISQSLRPQLASLYRNLHSPPGATVSVMPRMWAAFLHSLDSRAVVVREVAGLQLPLKARIIEVGSKPIHCKAGGPTWIRIADPTCPEIRLTNDAQNSLHCLLPRVESIPTTPLALPPLMPCLARADAMAEGDSVGIGGWITTRHSMGWFAEAFSMQEIRQVWPFMSKDAQRYIACFEALAQLALAMCARERHACSHLAVCLPSGSDNTPTEGGVNKLFTTSWPLSVFVGLLASWCSAHGMHLQVSHVAGARNQWADDLSRGRLQAFAHRSQERGSHPLDATGLGCLRSLLGLPTSLGLAHPSKGGAPSKRLSRVPDRKKRDASSSLALWIASTLPSCAK